ncbi:MAG: DUF1272 domain-containing protein [Arenicella sp.]
MLELRPNCECCDKDLPPDSTEAMICSFECTFCASCIESLFSNRCPNCGGSSLPRPTREGDALKRNPISSGKRILSNYEINIVKGEKTIIRNRIS